MAAGIDSAYDDNVYNSRGPDFVNRINAARVVSADRSARQARDGVRLLGYWTYAFGKANNSLNHRAHVGIEGKPTRRLTLKVGDEFSRAEDPGFLSRIGVVAPQIGIIDNVADALVGVNIVAPRVRGARLHVPSGDASIAYNAAMARRLAAALRRRGARRQSVHQLRGHAPRRSALRGPRRSMFTAGPQATRFDALGHRRTPTRRRSAGGISSCRSRKRPADAGPRRSIRRSAAPTNIVDAWAAVAPTSGWTWRGSAPAPLLHAVVARVGRATCTICWARPARAPRCGPTASTRRSAITISRSSTRTSASATSATAPPSIRPLAYDGVTADAFVDWRVINYFRLGAYYTLRWQETGPGAPPGAGRHSSPV